MPSYRYLKISGDRAWGKKELTKSEFVLAVQMNETIIDVQEMKIFNASKNQWEDIQGDT